MSKGGPRLPIGTLLALFTKSGAILKFLKFSTIAKPLLTFGTMTLSMFAYAFWLGPWFAVLFVLLLFIHEMGHVWAMRMRGFGTPAPVFIPFLGALIFAPKFENRHDEAFVGYGGPLLGTIGAVVVFGLYFMAPRESELAAILLAGSYAAMFLNLFNLIPLAPLDGGRVTQAVGKWFLYVGVIALAAFTVFMREPAILIIWLLILTDLTFIPARIRAWLAVAIGVSMAVLMLMGYSSQQWWLDLIDCVIAVAFTSIIFVAASRPELEEQMKEVERPQLEFRRRYLWAFLYLGLLAFLAVALAIQASYLPHHVNG